MVFDEFFPVYISPTYLHRHTGILASLVTLHVLWWCSGLYIVIDNNILSEIYFLHQLVLSVSYKTTFLETNPYLLAVTIIVSIIHSVFEFLAFKNGIYCLIFHWADIQLAGHYCFRSCIYFTLFIYRHSVLEEQEVYGRSVCEIRFLQCIPVSRSSSLRHGQRD